MDDRTSPALDESDVVAALTSAAVDLRAPLRTTLLQGGYSWRTYRVSDVNGASVVLRIAPAGGTLEPYDPRTEARAIAAARGSVPAPRVLAVESGRDPFGQPYLVQSLAPGRVLRLSAVTDVREREMYRATFAHTLGVLNREGDASMLGDAKTVGAALRDELARVAQRYLRAVRWPRPGFEIGLRWLLTHVPDIDEPPAYCHGDFRFGNMAWTGPGQLGAVLDWERAWCGDPMADVAFTRLFSGWCAVVDSAIAQYERAGRPVDETRVAYAMRFERVRSYTASMLGSRAFLDGRSSDPRLLAIGVAGERGMTELVDWLTEGDVMPLPAGWRAPCDPSRVAPHRPEALHASVAALRACTAPDGLGTHLSRALRTLDERVAWQRAFGLLAPLAATAVGSAVPALKAVSLAFPLVDLQTNG